MYRKNSLKKEDNNDRMLFEDNMNKDQFMSYTIVQILDIKFSVLLSQYNNCFFLMFKLCETTNNSIDDFWS